MKKLKFLVLPLLVITFLSVIVLADPFTRISLNTGTVTNQTAVSIFSSAFTSVFNKTTISTGVANLSSYSTIVKQRKNIGTVFDDSGDAISSTNNINLMVAGNFTMLTKARITSGGDAQGTFYYIGGAGGLTTADYAIGYQTTGNVLTFSIANGSTADTGTYSGYAPVSQINYMACGINASDTRWCSLNGNNISTTSYSRNYTYSNQGNNSIIGSTALSGNPLGDMNGNIYSVSLVNKTLSGDELNNYMWNDGQVTASLNVTVTKFNTNNNLLLMDNGTMIIFTYGGNSGTNVSISTNNGATQTFVTNLGTVFNDTITAFRDNYNNTFITNKANGGVWKSASNDLATWTNVLNMSCDNATNVGISTFQNLGFSQAPNGDEYISTYTLASNNNDEMCGHVYRSQDFGATWSLVFNASSVDSQYPGRHVHLVQADPYTGYIYTSIGDGVFRHGFYRSTDNGNTWTRIGAKYDKDISWQPTMIAFTPQYRIIGEDFNPVDGYSKIWRSSDDISWEEVANQNKDWYGFWGWSLTDPSGRIYTAQQVVDNSTNMVMLMSEDGFNSSSVAYLIPNGTFADLVAGIQGPSNFAKAANKFCFIINGVQNYTCANYIAKPQVLADWRLNENGGITTIDSINGYVGTFVNDTAWTNGSGYNLLNKNVDYAINTSSTYGNVTLYNQLYNNSQVEMALKYYSSESLYNSLKGYWSFDGDNSSTSFDFSDQNYTGAYVGSTYRSNYTNICVYGQCGTNFGAASSYVRIQDANAGNLTSNATIQFWARLNAGSNQLISKWNATTNNRMYSLSGNPADSQSNVFIMTYSRNGTSSNQSSFQISSVFRNGTWVNIALTRTDDTKWNFYIDGTWRGNYSDFMFNSGISDFRFGEREGGGFNGSIDEVMIFNTTLNEEQIQNIYRNNSQRFRQYEYSNYSYNDANSSNRADISLPILSLVNPLNSVFLYVYSGVGLPYTKTSGSYIYLANTNYTFNLEPGATNISLNFTLSSGNGFLTPVVGLNQSIYYYTVSESENVGTCNSLFGSFGAFGTFMAIIVIAVVAVFVIGLLFFSNQSNSEFLSKTMLSLGLAAIILVVMILLLSGLC